MSIIAPNIDILPAGMDADTQARGGFLQNLVRVSGAWQVRAGFGQVVGFDTGLAYGTALDLGGERTPSIRAHLGSRSIKTTFGHEQIVSAFSADVFTGNSELTNGRILRQVGRYVRAILVCIYDVTTRELWEEVLYPTTTGMGMPLERRHGVRETSQSDTFEAMGATTDSPLWWAEDGDVLYFGSADVGVWAYIPASFRGRREPQLHGETWRNAHFRGESESCLLREVPPGDGIYADAFAYLNAATFPRPTAACVINKRLVYAADRTLWFSDTNAPASIMALNFVQLPCPEEITAVLPLGDSVMVWTEHTTWFYQPDQTKDGLVSGGRLTPVHDSVGCRGPNTVTSTPQGPIWVDGTGVWTTRDGLIVKPVGSGVSAFWRSDGIASPLTGYYFASGAASLANEQPPVRWAWDEQDERVNVCYDAGSEIFLATFPTQRITLVWDGEGWALWNWESAVGYGSVQAWQRVWAPWLVAGDSLYAVGGPDALTVTDASRYPYTETPLIGAHVATSSWYLLEWGRGGGLDRSIEHVSEDRRVVQGRYYDLSGYLPAAPAGNHTAFYIDPWIPVPQGYVFPGGSTAAARTYLWPLSLIVDPLTGGQPQEFWVRFQFDSTNWRPVGVPPVVPATVDALHFSERLRSVPGYAEIGIYNIAGAPDPLGNEIRIHWATPAGPLPFAFMNIAMDQRSPLMYLPMWHVSTADTTSAGVVPLQANTTPPQGQQPVNAGFIAWQGTHLNSRYASDNRAQPVDWAIKGVQMAADGATVKSCGLRLRVTSHGRATGQLTASRYGLLNAACGSDYKDWVSQRIDYAPAAGPAALQEVVDVGTLRTRFMDNTSTMRHRTFNNGATYGDTTNGTLGNFLVDVEEFDTVQIADHCAGEHVSWMVHGTMLNRAEALTVGEMKADLVVLGGQKRKGR